MENKKKYLLIIFIIIFTITGIYFIPKDKNILHGIRMGLSALGVISIFSILNKKEKR